VVTKSCAAHEILPAFVEGIGNAAEAGANAICAWEVSVVLTPDKSSLSLAEKPRHSWPDSTAAWDGDQQFKAGCIQI